MDKLPHLPAPLCQMEKGDLHPLINNLLKGTSGRGPEGFGRGAARPVWWPAHIPWRSSKMNASESARQVLWTDALREVVKSCYAYHDQGHLLTCPQPARSRIEPDLPCIPLSQMLPCQTSSIMLGEAEEGIEANEALSATCIFSTGKPMEAATVHPAVNKKTFVEVYICLYCEEEFQSSPKLKIHELSCPKRSPSTYMCDSSSTKNLIGMLPPTPVTPEMPGTARKSPLVRALDLQPVSKSQRRTRSTRTFIDLSAIQLERETPKSPTSPLTPRSLMCQLSREPDERELSSDNGSESGSSSNEEGDHRRSQYSRISMIPVSSLLGQRLHHIDSISDTASSRSYEYFCKTPVKNRALGKLRDRDIKVTFKPRKTSNHVHEYKFTEEQRKEFLKRVATGLDQKSRKLKRLMKPLSVSLQNLSASDLKLWGAHRSSNQSKKDVKHNTPKFPNVPALRENDGKLSNMLGLHTTVDRKRSKTSLPMSHMVSEDVNAEIAKQQVIVYKSVLSELYIALTPSDSPNFKDTLGKDNRNKTHVNRKNEQKKRSKTTGVWEHKNKKLVTKGQTGNKKKVNTMPIHTEANLKKGYKKPQLKTDVPKRPLRNIDGNRVRKRSYPKFHEIQEKCPPAKKAKISLKANCNSETKGPIGGQESPGNRCIFLCNICGQKMSIGSDACEVVTQHLAREHKVTGVTMRKQADGSLKVIKEGLASSSPNISKTSKKPAGTPTGTATTSKSSGRDKSLGTHKNEPATEPKLSGKGSQPKVSSAWKQTPRSDVNLRKSLLDTVGESGLHIPPRRTRRVSVSVHRSGLVRRESL